MAKFQTVLFDLDGTLTDPGVGVTNAVAYALEKWGICNTDRRELYCFIGPPLEESFMRFYGLSCEDAARAIAEYRVYYSDRGLYENEVYPGIPELIDELRAAGLTVAVATSKPEYFARQVLEHFGLADRFDLICGATLDGSISQKADVIALALRRLEEMGRDTTHVVMVGDREQDVRGASAHGIPTIGVLFGYGDRTELEGAGARWIAEGAEDVGTLILL